MAGAGVVERIRASAGLPGIVVGAVAFTLAEYAQWVAILVYAYDRGGATESGLVALAQLVPAALLAPLLAAWTSRLRPARVLQGAYAALALTLVACGVGILLDSPMLAYGAAVASAVPMVVPRPAQAAALPALVADPEDLTTGSVGLGWADSVGALAAGLLSGVMLTVAGVGSLVLVTAGSAVAALLCAFPADRVTRSFVRGADDEADPVADAPIPWRSVRVVLGLLGVQSVLDAALDVLFVVLAIDVLRQGEGWAGYLQMSFGIGAVAAAPLSARLVGRRLAPAVIVASLVAGGALALTAPGPGVAFTVVAVIVAGGARAVFATSSRTLLLRLTPHRAIGRVFGVVEGCTAAGLAVGSLLVPLLVAAGGPSVALLGAAVLLPLAVLVGGRRLVRLEAGAPDRSLALAALRGSGLLGQLPAPALEELAGAAEPMRLAIGESLIREGEPGLDYYLITAGEAEVTQRGTVLRRLGPGAGVGEIALLRRSPRTATVVAVTDLEVLRIEGRAFLAAVTGHRTTMARVTQQAERWEPAADR